MKTVHDDVLDHFSHQWSMFAPFYRGGWAQREWTEHGTCHARNASNATTPQQVNDLQRRYFNMQLDLFINPHLRTPEVVRKMPGANTPIAMATIRKQLQLSNKMQGSVTCVEENGRWYVTRIAVCLGHDQFGGPMRQMSCPHVDTERNNCEHVDKVYLRSWDEVLAAHDAVDRHADL